MHTLGDVTGWWLFRAVLIKVYGGVLICVVVIDDWGPDHNLTHESEANISIYISLVFCSTVLDETVQEHTLDLTDTYEYSIS